MLALGDLLPAPSAPPPSRPVVRSARSRNRAAAWQHDLAQWRQYQIARAPDREAATNAEYEHQLAGGPDFTAYHVGSSFAEPPLHQITREDRVRALQAFDAVRAGLYRHCRGPRAQAVSQNYRHVYGVLLSYAVKRGRVFPCLETIAAAAMVSRTTVLRAIAWLKLFGFLDRIRRLKREQTPLGSVRVCQTSNAYRLTTTLTGLSALALGVFRGAPSATTRLHQPTQMLSNEQKAGLVTQFQFQSP
jgi:Helix-turn-helix domain